MNVCSIQAAGAYKGRDFTEHIESSEQVPANKQARQVCAACKARTAAGLRRGFATPHSAKTRRCLRRRDLCRASLNQRVWPARLTLPGAACMPCRFSAQLRPPPPEPAISFLTPVHGRMHRRFVCARAQPGAFALTPRACSRSPCEAELRPQSPPSAAQANPRRSPATAAGLRLTAVTL